MLHARAHASGLNLVEATHVILCEPLINTAIELQAIARVHRIGQCFETTVWMYLISDTIEESVYDISVRRRMAHLNRSTNGKVQSSDADAIQQKIEAANSYELQQAPLDKLLARGPGGGELVQRDDLWECLFGNPRGAKKTFVEDLDLEPGPAQQTNLAQRPREVDV
jgi:E3 ubiquitin-protein ligase SHPRH